MLVTVDNLFVGDVRDGLRSFIANGVRAQCCVTSPPYWGLRDYGTAEWDGGDPECAHLAPPRGGISPATSAKQLTSAGTLRYKYTSECADCGARRVDRQIGLEPTIAEYVATMVDVFRLVREVLADDGTLWLNLGDSYHNGDKGGYQNERTRNDSLQASNLANDFVGAPNRQPQKGLKPKDLCGIPWRVAFALQADGWWLRQDIIWAKPNPMPESVTDRCTKAHEYLFLLSKSERYYYDAAAIAERATHAGKSVSLGEKSLSRGQATAAGIEPSGNGTAGVVIVAENRNRRSVWEIATEAYPDAHFATFPRALVEPCIMAGSREGDTVLDPFMGSGTVAQVAQDLGRRWIGCELNPEYANMIGNRTRQASLLAAD